MSLKTIDFIREHGVDALAAQFAITVKRHPEFPNLVFLKYDQINSPMGEPICQECRGLILDEADDWRVISFPFRKFFNHGEGHAARIDWSTARVYEKLDGSLMTLYWYAGEWRVASNGTPDAGGPVQGCGGTFAELFWRVWNQMGYRLPDPFGDLLGMDCVFIFELMTPYNRVVVNHAECRIVLIGGRALKWDNSANAKDEPSDFCELEVEPWGYLGWEIVQSFPLNTADACVEAARHLDPLCTEGYVVCDANFNRIKIKSPQYVALAHLRDSVSPRRLLEIVRANESDEFLTYFPEFANAYNEVRARFDRLCVDVDWDYSRLSALPTQKDFALQAVKSRWSSALFDMRKGSVKTCREFAATCTMQSLERAIGLDAEAIAALLIPVFSPAPARPEHAATAEREAK